MDGSSKDPLDFADHRNRNLWFRDDDLLVGPFPNVEHDVDLIPNLFASLPISLYLVDTFTFAASATAAASVGVYLQIVRIF
jgi:hypothetical protein